MATSDELLQNTLQAYDLDLLRQVAGRLCKPRNQWPAEELIERSLATLTNTPVLDRRLRELDAPSRLVLFLMGHSHQPRWRVGHLVEMAVALGQGDGLAPVLDLLEAGLLFPDLGEKERVHHFRAWIVQSDPYRPPVVFAPAAVLERVLVAHRAGQAPPLPEASLPPGTALYDVTPLEADGLEWALRLSVMWQQVSAGPLRRTQQKDLFKRDLDRLHQDPLLAAPSPDALTELKDPGLLAVAWGQALNLLEEKEGDLVAGAFDPAWSDGLPQLAARLWSTLPLLSSWDPARGWLVEASAARPFPSVYLLALLLLDRLPSGHWITTADLDDWMLARHPFWSGGTPEPVLDNGQVSRPPGKPASKSGRVFSLEPALEAFFLGLAYPLRLVQATRQGEGAWHVRLSDLGRWVLGSSENPPPLPTFAQTLLVQPNLEVLAYRQGLSPDVIARLGRIATWKTLGPACTLQLEPGSVYRALEQGETLESIVRLLETRGMKAVPTPVLEALKTWANKRQRITVFPSAALFEFPGPAELNDALSRGLDAVRLTDRLAVVPAEKDIDYRHFRLTGTRDYCLPPEQCVAVLDDGVTLSIDLARSDLLLESELQRFAEPSPGPSPPGKRLYRLTPGTVQTARKNGLVLTSLQAWFQERTGLSLSPAARLLLTAPDMPPLDLRRQLILHVAFIDLADGLQQWPATRVLIKGRLGPTALVVLEKDVETLQARCAEIGVKLRHGEE